MIFVFHIIYRYMITFFNIQLRSSYPTIDSNLLIFNEEFINIKLIYFYRIHFLVSVWLNFFAPCAAPCAARCADHAHAAARNHACRGTYFALYSLIAAESLNGALSCGLSLQINYTDTCSPHPSICEKICVLMPQESPSVCSGSVGRRHRHPLVARQITINTTVAWPNERTNMREKERMHFILSC